ncbi:MAG: hypothetical protein EBR82_09175 [Caulobacteraceae bacterium]|nr:hypothetical protein [Caulobacteraceae bacterium]
MASQFKLTPTTGIVAGMTVQFADGVWPGEIGEGLAMTDDAFDVVEPLIQHAVPGWTSMHRYGVFELTPLVRPALARIFRDKAADYLATDQHPEANMLDELAEWLEARESQVRSVSVLGY